jgi:hypothetical protein
MQRCFHSSSARFLPLLLPLRCCCGDGCCCCCFHCHFHFQ